MPAGAHLISMKCPPPRPLAMGFSTPWHRAVATAASTALPPARSIDTPAQPAGLIWSGGCCP
jgi:hypothetical protein